ncbi:MAG: phage head closure protein [Planctomycetota bacterium]
MNPAGQFNKRVEIQSPQETFSGGERTVTWVTVATVWAKIETTAVGESQPGQQTRGEATHKVTLRYKASLLNSRARLKYGSRYLYLAGPPVDVDERGVEYELTCKEAA